MTSCARSRAVSSDSRRPTWVFTVPSATCRLWAISAQLVGPPDAEAGAESSHGADLLGDAAERVGERGQEVGGGLRRAQWLDQRPDGP
jgi:hypothetical protein